ncbi:MAG: hypothetical protein ABI441_16870 [Flavobacterium sp.]
MKFRKGQNVVYTTVGGNSYNATVVEARIEFSQCVIKRNRNLYYIIQLEAKNIKEPILCMENNLAFKDHQKQGRVKYYKHSINLLSTDLLPDVGYPEPVLNTFSQTKKVKDK